MTFTKNMLKGYLEDKGFVVKDLTIDQDASYDYHFDGLSFWAKYNGYILSLQCRWDKMGMKSYGTTDREGNYENIEIALWKEEKNGKQGEFLKPKKLFGDSMDSILSYQDWNQIVNAINWVYNTPIEQNEQKFLVVTESFPENYKNQYGLDKFSDIACYTIVEGAKEIGKIFIEVDDTPIERGWKVIGIETRDFKEFSAFYNFCCDTNGNLVLDSLVYFHTHGNLTIEYLMG